MAIKHCVGKPLEELKHESTEPCSGFTSADLQNELLIIDERLTRLEKHLSVHDYAQNRDETDEDSTFVTGAPTTTTFATQRSWKSRRKSETIEHHQRGTLQDHIDDILLSTGLADIAPVNCHATASRVDRTAAEWLANRSLPAKLIFIMGGIHVFKNKRLQQGYTLFWAMSFWICGGLCFANLVCQDLPFHNFSTDFLTAYVHIPAFLSWLFWRRFLQSAHGQSMLKMLQTLSDSSRNLFLTMVRGGAWCILSMMVTMTAIVLSGFSLPAHTEVYGPPSKEFMTEFMGIHALVMWPVIPPVIMSLVGSYSMAIFFGFLHIRDVRYTTTRCMDVIQKANEVNKEAFALDGQTLDEAEASILLDLDQTHSRIKDVMEIFVGEVFQKSRNETDFEIVAVTIELLVKETQKKIDVTCHAMQNIMMHLLIFSWAQILVVMTNVQFHFGSETSTPYTYYWICQDIFHFTVGVVLVATNLTLGTVVTAYATSLKWTVVRELTEQGMSRMKLAAITSMLNQRLVGFHFFHVPVNLSEVFPFVFSTVLLLFATFCAIADHQFVSDV